MRRRIKGILMSGKQFSLDSHLDLVQGIERELTNRPISEPTAAASVLLEEANEHELSKSGRKVHLNTIIVTLLHICAKIEAIN